MNISEHPTLNNRSGTPAAGVATSVAAIGLAAACVACCLPLVTPLLAWLGLSGLGTFAAGYWWLGGGLALTGADVLLRRRSSARQAGTCGCPGTGPK